ncbi:hypothetical protein ACP70R_004796 [Stipagrostis hirtigluma subsp. patula]
MRLCHCSLLAALLLALVLGCAAKTKFDFFYHVQQWPGSYCDTKHCCFPHGKKPAADFGIHGMWPNYAECPHDGNCWPEYCDCDDLLNETLASAKAMPTSRCCTRCGSAWASTAGPPSAARRGRTRATVDAPMRWSSFPCSSLCSCGSQSDACVWHYVGVRFF